MWGYLHCARCVHATPEGPESPHANFPLKIATLRRTSSDLGQPLCSWTCKDSPLSVIPQPRSHTSGGGGDHTHCGVGSQLGPLGTFGGGASGVRARDGWRAEFDCCKRLAQCGTSLPQNRDFEQRARARLHRSDGATEPNRQDPSGSRGVLHRVGPDGLRAPVHLQLRWACATSLEGAGRPPPTVLPPPAAWKGAPGTQEAGPRRAPAHVRA